MTVKDIIKAQEMCFITDTSGCGHCKLCPMFDKELQNTTNCQELLAKVTIHKLKELNELLDDTVNHHYYETLEMYQEENTNLREAVQSVLDILTKNS